ncbi:hypothetical protein DFO53_4570 [Enterobacter sp. AG5470]|nr:hypothetical protein DFO53_4570 [Enterobacter sp. AG5470]
MAGNSIMFIKWVTITMLGVWFYAFIKIFSSTVYDKK